MGERHQVIGRDVPRPGLGTGLLELLQREFLCGGGPQRFCFRDHADLTLDGVCKRLIPV